MKGHYFFQDIWAANKIFRSKVDLHYDIASRIDGFIAHILPFTNVKYLVLLKDGHLISYDFNKKAWMIMDVFAK